MFSAVVTSNTPSFCVHVCLSVCACICVYITVNFGCILFLGHWSPFFLTHGLSLSWNLSSRLNWLASKSQGSAYLCCPMLPNIKMCKITFIYSFIYLCLAMIYVRRWGTTCKSEFLPHYVGLGPQTQAVQLSGMWLYPSHAWHLYVGSENWTYCWLHHLPSSYSTSFKRQICFHKLTSKRMTYMEGGTSRLFMLYFICQIHY